MSSSLLSFFFFFFFFFNDTATTEIYTLSLHDALSDLAGSPGACRAGAACPPRRRGSRSGSRSEEHTSELQSQFHLVCRLLLEKKKKNKTITEIEMKYIRGMFKEVDQY